MALDRTTVTGRSICDKQTVHVADLQSPDNDFPLGREIAIKAGTRTALGVPLLREGNALGTILVRRTEVRPFEDKHIALLKTSPIRPRSRSRTRGCSTSCASAPTICKSLEQQTATSEVLRVISSSPGDLEPVFNAMLENAARICGAKFGVLSLADGDAFCTVALHGAPPAYAEYRRREPLVSRHPEHLARVAATKQAAQIDVLLNGLADADPNLRWRSFILPMPARCLASRCSKITNLSASSPSIAGGPPVHRQADRAGGELRRAGGDRDRERAPAQRGARSRRASSRRSRRSCAP